MDTSKCSVSRGSDGTLAALTSVVRVDARCAEVLAELDVPAPLGVADVFVDAVFVVLPGVLAGAVLVVLPGVFVDAVFVVLPGVLAPVAAPELLVPGAAAGVLVLVGIEDPDGVSPSVDAFAEGVAADGGSVGSASARSTSLTPLSANSVPSSATKKETIHTAFPAYG